MLLNELDLSFYQYLASDAGAFWLGIPEQATSTTPAWQWSPAMKLVMDGDLETIDQLIGNGWERLTSEQGTEYWNSENLNGTRYLRLASLLADVRLLQMPGQSDYELWARTADVRRADANPVTLAFAQHGFSEEDFPRSVLSISESGLTTLSLAQLLPPPQFGEIALVDHTHNGQRIWQIYMLAALGDEGLALWQRMGRALAALAAPGAWWAKTGALVACQRGEYPQLRAAIRAAMQEADAQQLSQGGGDCEPLTRAQSERLYTKGDVRWRYERVSGADHPISSPSAQRGPARMAGGNAAKTAGISATSAPRYAPRWLRCQKRRRASRHNVVTG